MKKNYHVEALDELTNEMRTKTLSKVDSRKPLPKKEVESEEEEEGSELKDEMKEAGHEGVERAEAEIFPKEEMAEDRSMISDGDKALIKQLYEKFCV